MAVALLCAARPPAAAQAPRPHQVRWQEAGAAAAGLFVTILVVDGPVQEAAQQARSPASDDVAAVLRRMGEPEVFLVPPALAVGIGLVAGDAPLRRSGYRIVAALALAGVTTTVAKEVTGRLRPGDASPPDPLNFRPFSGQDAFPSGHTTMAFALAASVAQEVHRTWVTVPLYALAAGTGWSRINDDRHWLADVAGGALVGITAARLVSGRWQVFGLRPPSFLIGPGGMGVRWQATF